MAACCHHERDHNTMNDAVPPALLRDPQALLHNIRSQWGPGTDLWVFGYASLIWRPEFDSDEHRPALLRGWHRAFRMHSHGHRGTPERPGLVFALMPGGSCKGVVYRVARARADDELARLWAREMGSGEYDPRWLPCGTAQGPVMALAFTLSRRSPKYAGRLADEEMLQILREAKGRFGSTLDYLAQTGRSLQERGVADREIERLLALARRHRLL
jgi:cation transport protein ChaC